MDFIDQVRNLAQRAQKLRDTLQTEEATKNALVLPFLSALGYDVFDPTEVIPEFTADVVGKKGEKVDYAIIKDGTPIMLIECKKAGVNLDNEHASQLFRYFTAVLPARIGVLTDGIVYRFFTDLEQPNVMDTKPFLEIDFFNIKDVIVNEVKKFHKSTFNLASIVSNAGELKYANEIKRLLFEQIKSPSPDFVKFVGKQIYNGSMTQKVLDQFTDITRKAFIHLIDELIDERLKSAMALSSIAQHEQSMTNQVGDKAETNDANNSESKDKDIITTAEEMESFYIVKSILRETIDPSRIAMRDTMTYCGILLDDNNRKPICRLYFNRSQKYIGLFNAEKNEQKIPLDNINDIYKHSENIKQAVKAYIQTDV
jgi:hypothetical protein